MLGAFRDARLTHRKRLEPDHYKSVTFLPGGVCVDRGQTAGSAAS